MSLEAIGPLLCVVDETNDLDNLFADAVDNSERCAWHHKLTRIDDMARMPH